MWNGHTNSLAEKKQSFYIKAKTRMLTKTETAKSFKQYCDALIWSKDEISYFILFRVK
jgi:hypothetical protein